MFHSICVLSFSQHKLEQKAKLMIYRHALRRWTQVLACSNNFCVKLILNQNQVNGNHEKNNFCFLLIKSVPFIQSSHFRFYALFCKTITNRHMSIQVS